MIRNSAAVVILAIASVACREKPAPPVPPSLPPEAAPPPAPATPDSGNSGVWLVGLHATGPLRYGMTLDEAIAATGAPVKRPASADGCGLLIPRGAPAKVSFMVEAGRIVRVDVDSGGPKTDRGAGIGTTETEIHRIYAGGLVVTPHKYDPKGHFMMVVPVEPADSSFRIVFETDGAKVIRFRAGVEPAVEYVEGCG